MHQYLKKHIAMISLFLTLTIGLFPKHFLIMGRFLSIFIINYWLQIILGSILLLLIYICKLCLAIKNRQSHICTDD